MADKTQLELFYQTVEHRPHESYLFYANFTPDIEARLRTYYNISTDIDMRDFFGMYKPCRIGMTPPEEHERPDYTVYYGDIAIPEEASINDFGVLHLPGEFYHFKRKISPLRNARSLEEIERFPIPTFDKWSEATMEERVKQAHRDGKVASSYIGHMYEDAWQIRGYEQFLEDMMLRPAWCESILDRLMRRNRQLACAAARAGVDVIETGDDVANQKALMFSPRFWRKFIKEKWKQVYRAALDIKPDLQIWYHSDGNITDIIGELIEIGVTILNPVQPECLDPEKVKAKWGRHITIDGTVGTQSTMPWSDADGVRRIVRERIETIGRDGALILSPTHTLEPEVPIENVEAFLETAKAQ